MLWSQLTARREWLEGSESDQRRILMSGATAQFPGIWFEKWFEKWSAGDLKMEISPPKLALDLLSQFVDDFLWGCLIVSKSTKKKMRNDCNYQYLDELVIATLYMFEWLPVITKYEWGTWVLGTSSCDFLVRWISSQVLGCRGPQGTNLAGWGPSFVPMFEGQVTHGG